DIAENDRVSWAGLLAGGLQFAILNFAIFALGIDAVLGDALHAISTFFHDAAAAHGHIRIAHHLVLRRFPILEEKEVEAPHFVWAVIGTIARAHAAVVDHVIQAFGAVHSCAHGTHYFARRILTLHARDGLEVCLGIIAVALIIGIDTQPVHVAADHDLLFANDRNVVLRLAGDGAIIAADAGVQINGHAPYIGFFLVRIGLVQRQFRGWLFFFGEVWFLAILFETRRAYLRARAFGRVHGLVALSGRQLVGATSLGNIHAGGEPWRRAVSKRVHVETCAGSGSPG